MSNNIDRQYLELVNHILRFGYDKKDRTGTGTKSIFGWQIRHSMKDGFPLLTTKKMAFKTMATELIWFLRGDTNIKYLVDNDCHIWDGDVYKKYFDTMNSDEYIEKWIEPSMRDEARKNKGKNGYTKEEFINHIKTDDEFAKTWGELGPIYGRQWRGWGSNFIDDLDDVYTNEVDYDIQNGRLPDGSSMRKFVIDEIKKHNPRIDQIQNLINELKTNPDSRRMIVNAWAVHDLEKMVLPPCHMMFQFYTRELSLEERLRLVNYDKEKFNSIDEWITWYNNEPNEFYYAGINYTKDTALTDLGVPTRAISLQWTQRSVDVGLGLPFNIASYALLLELVAKSVNMVPEDLIGNLGDCHIYNNHVDGLKEQLERTPYELPKLNINTEWWPTESGECGVGPIDATAVFNSFTNDHFCKCLLENDIQLYNYQPHPAIKLPLSN